MVFEATTAGSDDLKAVVSAISTLVEEATFVANKDGVKFRGMDPSHVALIDIDWPNSAFEKYECSEEMNFGVRIDEFSKIIKRADKKDGITLSISDATLIVQIGKNKKYKIRLVESEASDTPVPKTEFTACISMTSSRFDKLLGDIGVVSDFLEITVTENSAKMGGKGDSGEVEIILEKDDPSVDEITAKGENSGTYSIEYLNPVIKAVGGSAGSVKCEFSDTKPIRIEFQVADVGRIHFYLAPRVGS